jgi:hypothetical protein
MIDVNEDNHGGGRACELATLLGQKGNVNETTDDGSRKHESTSVDTSDEEMSSSGSKEKSKAPKTMADVVITATSKMERKMKENVAACNNFPGTFTVTGGMSMSYSPNSSIAELSNIERSGVISVLEDCIDQLRIVGETNKNTTVPSDLQYRSLEERYMNSQIGKLE